MKNINQFENYLLDLDGTLVEAPQKRFLIYNTVALYKRFVGLFGPFSTVPVVKKSIDAALNNNGNSGMTNYEMIVETCHSISKVPKEKIVGALDVYYEKDFLKWSALFYPVPGAIDFVKEAKLKGKNVYIWTNPIWPEFNVFKRLEWAGYDLKQFSGFTHSKNMIACKPNVKYYAASLKLFNLDPKSCLLIGDSEFKDGPARQVGIETLILTKDKLNFWQELTQKLK